MSLANVWHAPNLVIVRVVLTPSERRELLRAVSVLGGDRYTNHIGHFQSIARASIEPASSSVLRRPERSRCASSPPSPTISIPRASTGFSSSVDHARTADVASSSRSRRSNRRSNKFSTRFRGARLTRPSRRRGRRRARGYECRPGRPHAAAERTSFSKRTRVQRSSPWVISRVMTRRWI